MKVSIIIVTYNYGHLIGEAIASAQAQTFQDFEIVVIDDGSTDDTQEVLSRIDDPRLRVHRVPNGGEPTARNIGMSMARGEYMAFLDADDRWRPTKLERQVAIMESEPEVGLVFTDFARFEGERVFPHTQFDFIPDLPKLPSRPSAAGSGRVITGDTFLNLAGLTHLPAWPSVVMVRTSSVEGITFPTGARLCADLHYMLRIYPRVQAAYIAEPLSELRRHGNNSYNALGEIIEATVAVLERAVKEPLAPQHREVLLRRLGREWTGLGYFHYHSRNPTRSASAALRALRFPGSRKKALKRLALLPALPLLADSRNVDWNVGPEKDT